MPAEVDSSSAIAGGVVVAILAAIAAPFVRHLNGREAAKDRATADHIGSLRSQIDKGDAERLAIQARLDLANHTNGESSGEVRVLREVNARLLDESESLRVQNSALQGDTILMRQDIAGKAAQIEEQIKVIDLRDALLKTHNVPFK